MSYKKGSLKLGQLYGFLRVFYNEIAVPNEAIYVSSIEHEHYENASESSTNSVTINDIWMAYWLECALKCSKISIVTHLNGVFSTA